MAVAAAIPGTSSDVPIRVGGLATEITRRPGALEDLRQELAEQGAIRLPGFLTPDLLHLLRTRLEAESFEAASYPDIGTEMTQGQGVAVESLLFLLNDPVILDAVSRIGTCGRVGWFTGRIYKLHSERWKIDGWHDDVYEGRLLTLSINLSAQPYEGGVLEMRDKSSKRVLAEFANPVAGDAILFRVAPTLEHRVTPVTGPNPRTSFAGWFLPGPRMLVSSSAPRLDVPAP